MSIYILCFADRYMHAKHYIGFTEDECVQRRLGEHLSGGSKANPLVKAAVHAGIEVRLAHTYKGPLASRTFERRLKNRRDVNRWCPLCSSGTRNPPPLTCEPLDALDDGPDDLSDRARDHARRREAVREPVLPLRPADEGVDDDLAF